MRRFTQRQVRGRSNTDCAWQLIIDRYKAFGRTDRLFAYVPPKDWRAARAPGPRKLVREDTSYEPEQAAGDTPFRQVRRDRRVRPARGANAEAVRQKAALLKDRVDAVNVTDNQTAVVRMSSIAASAHLVQMGIEPVMQMVTRDRNRIALQSDIMGAYSLGIRNILCLSGDHQTFGSQPDAGGVFDIDSMHLLNAVKTMRERARI